MTLQNAAALVASFKNEGKSVGKEEILSTLAGKAVSREASYAHSPTALVDTIEACLSFVLHDVKPFVLDGEAVICPETQLCHSLKLVMGLSEPIQLLKSGISKDELSPELKAKVFTALAALHGHLQFLSKLKSFPESAFHALEQVKSVPLVNDNDNKKKQEETRRRKST